MSAEDLLTRRARLGESAPSPRVPEAERRGAAPDVGPETSRVLPPADAFVQSVWESRLINMRDFYFAPLVAIPEDGSNVLEVNMVVPAARFAALRAIRFDTTTQANGLFTQFLLTLLHNGVPVPEYIQIPTGPLLIEALPTFLLADEGDRIGLRFEFPNVYIASSFIGHFYGQLGLRGRKPVNLEVAGEPGRAP